MKWKEIMRIQKTSGRCEDAFCEKEANDVAYAEAPWSTKLWCVLNAKLRCTKGQGTTEYAILVGVLTKFDSILFKKHQVRSLIYSR